MEVAVFHCSCSPKLQCENGGADLLIFELFLLVLCHQLDQSHINVMVHINVYVIMSLTYLRFNVTDLLPATTSREST